MYLLGTRNYTIVKRNRKRKYETSEESTPTFQITSYFDFLVHQFYYASKYKLSKYIATCMTNNLERRE